MHLLVVILKQVELLDDILKHLAEHNITGGTIMDGTGMAETLVNMEDLPMFGLLRKALSGEEKESCKIMLFVIKDDKLIEARDTIREAIDLAQANTGILFAMPLSFVEGLGDRSWN